MSRYESIDCPICKKPLDNGDEIVVCPECGAPYHRSCFAGEGHCIFPELHERNEAWQPPKKEGKFQDASRLICSRCGSLNPPYGLFCQVCGNPLNNPRHDGQAQPGQPQPGQPPYQTPYAQGGPDSQVPPNPYGPSYPPFGGPGGPIPPQMPLNPYTTPFGGVAPDEEIDGVPAKDLAIFVGKNSHYFLPRFKQISQTKAKVVNWSAFLFEGGYFLYRKMYGLGILFLLLDVLLSLPQSMLLLQGDLAASGLALTASSQASTTLTTLNLLCNVLSWAMRFVCGFFANNLYFSHCKRKISEERAAAQDNDQYYALLSKKGSVAVKLVTGLLIAYAVLYFLSVVLLLLTGNF